MEQTPPARFEVLPPPRPARLVESGLHGRGLISIMNCKATCFVGMAVIVLMWTFLGCVVPKRYNRYLLIDSRDYAPAMTWDEIREASFKKHYSVRITDLEGKAISLYRVNHDDGSILLEEEAVTSFGALVIIDAKYRQFNLILSSDTKASLQTEVTIGSLSRVKDRPEAFIVPVALASGGNPAGSHEHPGRGQ